MITTRPRQPSCLSHPPLLALGAAGLLVLGCNRSESSQGAAASGSAAPSASTAASAEPPKASGATALPAASVDAFVNPAHLPVYEGPTGSIEGTVTVTGDPPPDTLNRDYAKCPAGEKTYRKLFREGPARADGSRPVADVLVAVTGYAGAYLKETKPSRSITIDDCAFSSRTVDMTIGQSLEIENKMRDKIFAPAFLQSASPLSLVATPLGDPVYLYPQAPRVFTLYDKFGAGSAYLTGEVYVLVQPLHTVTDLQGHYRIDGIPVGQVTVNGLLGVIQRETSKTVEVKKSVVETVNLELVYHASAPKLVPPPPTSASPVDAAAVRRNILK